MGSAPLVSVGMCSWNSASTIESAMASLQSQDYSNWELIVIDANSADDSTIIIQNRCVSDPRIKLISCDWQQPWTTSTLQQLRLAQGEYFMWLDPDDFLSPNWISSLIRVHSENTCIGAVGILQLIDKNNKVVINNASSGRYFRFTADKWKHSRIIKCLSLPESFGVVNFLYGLWSIDTLRGMNLWSSDDRTLTFDQIFALETLSRGRIIYTNDSYHCRRTHWDLLRTSGLKANPVSFDAILTKERKISVYQYLFELLTIRPTFKLYVEWLKRQDLKFKFLYFLVIFLRRILSKSAPLVYWLNRLFREV